jgi:hypothetical protein
MALARSPLHRLNEAMLNQLHFYLIEPSQYCLASADWTSTRSNISLAARPCLQCRDDPRRCLDRSDLGIEMNRFELLS